MLVLRSIFDGCTPPLRMFCYNPTSSLNAPNQMGCGVNERKCQHLAGSCVAPDNPTFAVKDSPFQIFPLDGYHKEQERVNWSMHFKDSVSIKTLQ